MLDSVINFQTAYNKSQDRREYIQKQKIINK